MSRLVTELLPFLIHSSCLHIGKTKGMDCCRMRRMEIRSEADRSFNLQGLDVDAADVDKALAVNASEWRQELPLIEEWFEFVGDKLPTGVRDEFEALKQRLAESD